MGYLKTQFLEIIQWLDESRDTLSFRYPDTDKEIKRVLALLENDPGRSDFMEAVYRYHPHFMASRLKKDREREQQERESTVPAA